MDITENKPSELDLIIQWGEYRINYVIQEVITRRYFILDIFGKPVGIRSGCYPRTYKDQNGWIKTDYPEVYFCDKFNEPRPQVGILEYEDWKRLMGTNGSN